MEKALSWISLYNDVGGGMTYQLSKEDEQAFEEWFAQDMPGWKDVSNGHAIKAAMKRHFMKACEHKDKEIREIERKYEKTILEMDVQLASERARTLRYKELLYSQTEQGVKMGLLEDDLEWALETIKFFSKHWHTPKSGMESIRENIARKRDEIRKRHKLEGEE